VKLATRPVNKKIPMFLLQHVQPLFVLAAIAAAVRLLWSHA